MDRRPIKNSVFAFICQSLEPFKWEATGLFCVSIFSAIDTSLRPYILKVILNNVASHQPHDPIGPIWYPGFLYIGISLFAVGVWRFYDWILLRLFPPLKRHIGTLLMQHTMGHSFRFFQNQFAGSLANKINNCLTYVPDLVKILIEIFLGNLISLFVAIYALGSVQPKFAWALTIWVTFFIGVNLAITPKAKRLSLESAEEGTRGSGHIVDILSNIGNVRLFSKNPAEGTFVENNFKKWVGLIQQREWFFLKLHVFQDTSFVIFQGVCLYWLIEGVQKQTLTPGDFALIITVNASLLVKLWNLSQELRNFNEGYGQVAQGLNLVSNTHEIQDRKEAKPLIVTKGEIVVDNLQFYYRGSKPLFENLSVRIAPGEKVGLVGFSGSGKSSFVNLILRLFDVNDGRILIDGQNIAEVTQASLRQAIAMIPQEPSLFHRSLMDNILYGREEASEEEVIEAAKKAAAHDFILQLPEGYDSLAGERGVKLSGGQRQRIAIARAFLKNAPILILDEATSQLDSITENLIQDSLTELMKNRTTLIIAHRLSTLLQMDRILVFDHGKIVEEGTHQELLQKNGLYTRLWEAQVGGFLPDKS